MLGGMLDKLTLLEKAALLGGKSVWETRDLPRRGIGSVLMADGPHGVRRQSGSFDNLGLGESEPATCFPTSAAVANSWDLFLAEEIGRALGAEAAAQGVDVLLGPGLNIKRSPLAGRNFEYFSEDPYLAGKLAAAFVRGIQSQGTAATPKHFAANNQELRRMASDSVVDERTLREIYLTAFEIVVREAHPRALMSSYNLVGGTYAHENRWLLTEVLRDEWGFDGVVITDWGGGNDAVAAVEAGGTIEMPKPGLGSARQIVRAVEVGELAVEHLDARAAEVLKLVREARTTAGAADLDAHHALARRAAAESAVLLRNEGGILPLRAGTSVALIGDMAETPRYQGAGSSLVNPTRLSTAREAFASSGLSLAGFARGYRRNSAADPELERAAVDLAAEADVAVLFLGLDEASESEGTDRTSLAMPAAQISLLRAVAAKNPRVVVVLSAGGVVDLSWSGLTQGLLHAHLAGQAGAEGIVDVLTGAVNPSGKLAESYPHALGDTPTHATFPAEVRHAMYREGPFVGYRFYEAAGRPVKHPFGFGLSYTTFEYSGLAVLADGVRFTVTNTGPVAGAEVAQLYVSRPGSAVLRPEKELKGFAKVFLEPGESRQVTIPFDRYTWRHYDVGAGAWRTEGGTWEVRIGASSADIRLTGETVVDGEVVASPYDVAAMRSALLRGADDATFALLLGRPVPREAAARELTASDPLRELHRARSPLARLAIRVLRSRIRRAEEQGRADLNLLFVYNMPLRAVAKMSGGRLDDAMVQALLTAINGRHLRGIRQLVRAFLRNRRNMAQAEAELRKAGIVLRPVPSSMADFVASIPVVPGVPFHEDDVEFDEDPEAL